jgi:hypothetical protein
VASFARHAALNSPYLLQIRRCQLCRAASGRREPHHPLGDTIRSERRQPFDIAVSRGGQHHADGRHIGRCHLATPEHHVNQCAAHTTVAVGKRVDRLELCVHESSLNEGWKHVIVECVAQVGEQARLWPPRVPARGVRSACPRSSMRQSPQYGAAGVRAASGPDDSKLNESAPRGTGTNASYLQARRYLAGELLFRFVKYS